MDSSAAAAAYHPITLRAISVMMDMRYSSCEQGQSSRLVSDSMVCLFSAMTESMVRAWVGPASVPVSEGSVPESVQLDGALGNSRVRMSRATAKQQVRDLLLKLLLLLLLGLVLATTQSKAEAEEANSGSDTDSGMSEKKSGLVVVSSRLALRLLELLLGCSGQSSTMGEWNPISNRLPISVSMSVNGGESPVEWAIKTFGDIIEFHKSVSGPGLVPNSDMDPGVGWPASLLVVMVVWEGNGVPTRRLGRFVPVESLTLLNVGLLFTEEPTRRPPMRERMLAVLADLRADSTGALTPTAFVLGQIWAVSPFAALDEVRPVRRDTM